MNNSLIFSSRPILNSVIEKYGQLPLQDYLNQVYKKVISPINERQSVVVDAICAEITEILPDADVQALRLQLQESFCVSTAEHHAFLGQAFNLSAALQTSAAKPKINGKNPAILVLAFGINSLSNSDYPRGIMLHTDTKSDLYRLPILPRPKQGTTIATVAAYLPHDIQRAEQTLAKNVQNFPMTFEQKEMLTHQLHNIFSDPLVLNQKNFADQVTTSNFLFWTTLQTKLDTDLGHLYYLTIERVVNRILITHHLPKVTLIASLITDPAYQTALQQLEKCITSELAQGEMPTHLFWGIDQDGCRHALIKKENTLQNTAGTISIPLNPESIAIGIREKKLLPNMFLCYLILNMYHRLLCLGGYKHINYLTAMDNAYQKLGLDDNKQLIPEQLLHYSLITTWARTGTEVLPATAWDILIYSMPNIWSIYKSQIMSLSLEDIFKTAVPWILDTPKSTPVSLIPPLINIPTAV